MPLPVKLLLFYLAGISLVSAAVTIADKRKARQHKWRIPEATLLLLAALGGSAAMYITMRCIRHKTQKAKFRIGIPLILALQLAAAAAVALALLTD